MTRPPLPRRRPKFFLAGCVLLAIGAVVKAEEKAPAVTWTDGVKAWPVSLPVYAIQPTAFNEAFTERLKKASGILESFKTELPDEAAEPEATAYVNPVTNASIAIYPLSGLFVYSNPVAEGDATKPPQNVPDETSTRKLADELLETIGISADQLAVNPATKAPRVLYNKQARRLAGSAETEDQIYVRGVQYFQAVGGYPVIARERARGAHIQFGAEGQLLLVDLNWLNAVLLEEAPAITRDDATKAILSGRGKWKTALGAAPAEYEVTAAHVVLVEPASRKQPLTPSLVLVAKVKTEDGTQSNEFTCDALASEHVEPKSPSP